MRCPRRGVAQQRIRIVFWNVENLFDIWDDSTRLDDDFTPQGLNHWTAERYDHKLKQLCRTLVAMGTDDSLGWRPPLLVGMAEVENDKVLRDLCLGTPLRRYGYKFIHFDSPDRRGIDNALLYRSDGFKPFLSKAIGVSDSAADFLTRDILLVGGTTSEGDTILLLVNHFPSKRGGATAERRRMATAQRLRSLMDSLAAAYPAAAVVTLGDFNASPSEPVIRKGLMQRHRHGADGFVNLMEQLPAGSGSYKSQDHWSCLDQIILSRNLTNGHCRLQVCTGEGPVFDAGFLLTDDEKYLGKKLLRTYLGPRYLGGFSDHLPVFVDLHPVD